MKREPILRWREVVIAVLLPLGIAGGVRLAWQRTQRNDIGADKSATMPAVGNGAAPEEDVQKSPEPKAETDSVMAGPNLSSAFATLSESLSPDGSLVLAVWCELAGKLDNTGAEAFFRLILDSCKRTRRAEDHDTLEIMGQFAHLLANTGGKGKEGDRYEEAERLLRSVLEIRERTLGPDHPETLESVERLALRLRYSIIKAKAAEPYYRRSVESRLRIHGPAHDETLKAMTGLAEYLNDRREYAKAEDFYRQVIEIREHTLGPDHQKTLIALIHFAGYFSVNGRLDETISLHRRVLETRLRVLGPDHRETIYARMNLAGPLTEKGEYAEAERLLRQTVKSYQRIPDHCGARIQEMRLAELLRKAGKTEEAKAAAWRAYRGLAKAEPRQPAWLKGAQQFLVEMGENLPDAP